MVKKFISTLVLVVALVGTVSAQSLDDISKKVYDLSIEAINKGKNRQSAYEEYLEKQELEAAKKAEEEDIKLDYIIILQDAHNPEAFAITW